MKKSVCAVIAACFVLCTSVVCAKVYWLPDYIVDGTSKRSHNETDSNIKRTGAKSSDYNCATYDGFLPSEVGSKKCNRRIQLPQGTICYIECCDPCNKTYYNLTSIPAKAKVTESCDDTCDSATYYKLVSCETNYEKNGDTCTACVWGDYTLSQDATVEGAKGYESQTCGGITKKKITGCNNGYTQSGNTCTACSWGDYTLSSNSGVTGAKGYESKSCGNMTKYKITGCNNGYTQSGNTCTACTWGDYTLSSGSGVTGAKGYEAKTCGNITKYKITGCNNGYTQSGNTCTACTWGDYTLSSGSGVTGAKGYEAKTCGNITKYKITGCKDGYNQNGNSCTEKSCQAGYATTVSGCGTAPTNSQYSLGSTTNGYSGESACKNCKLSCKSGKASSCSSGYEVTNKDTNGCGTCTACTWDGYTLTSRNVANAAAYAESTCGGTTKYKVTTCSTGYDVNSTGTACIAQSCPSGQATSVAGCGTGPSNGYYSLGASSGSSVGGVACQYCIWRCNNGYKMCNGDCVSYCSSYSSDYDSCPPGADCNYDSNTCCYSVSGCQSGYQYCYGNCISESDYCY